jgi:hypothetical protein
VELELQAFLISVLGDSVQIFQKSMNHLKILGAKKDVKCRQLRTEKPQILGATLQNLVS